MVRIHREPPSGGASGRSSGLYPLRRQISAARQVRLLHPLLTMFRAGSSTDQNSWPTPNRCGFNSRTAHHRIAGLARRSSPRSIIARCWFDSNILHQFIRGLAVKPLCSRQLLARSARIGSPSLTGDWQRWLMHSPLKRDQAGSIPASPTKVCAGLADAAMHSPFKRDEAGSIPASRTRQD